MQYERPLIANTQMTVTLAPGEHDTWTVDYDFGEIPPRTLIFDRSNGDYRTGTWTALQRDVRLERLRGFDTLVLDAPMRHARFTVVPFGEVLDRDHIPWLKFSNGDVAIFTGQFGLLPVVDRQAALQLDGQLGNWHGKQPRIGVRVTADRRQLFLQVSDNYSCR